MKVVIISDNHNHYPEKMPSGDLLIHCGDYSKLPRSYKAMGSKDQYKAYCDELLRFEFFMRLCRQHYEEVIFVPGNHDFFFEQREEDARKILGSATVLINESCQFRGHKIWGSPYTPRFHDWAYNCAPEKELNQHWEKVPSDTDILVTHGPPYGILDQVEGKGSHLGHLGLLETLDRVQPRLHCFGHIHSANGVYNSENCTFVNGSLLNESYEMSFRPTVIEV